MPPLKVVEEQRRTNLQTLIENYGTVEALARAVKTDPTYLVNIKNGVRDMGSKKARQIERALSLPKGGMDASELGALLPIAPGQVMSDEAALAYLQMRWRIDKAQAERAIAVLDVMFSKEKPNAKKKGAKRSG